MKNKQGKKSKLQKSLFVSFNESREMSDLTYQGINNSNLPHSKNLKSVKHSYLRLFYRNDDSSNHDQISRRYISEIFAYSEYLYSLELYQQRAFILKCTMSFLPTESSLEIALQCRCSNGRGHVCKICFPKGLFVCGYCRLPCRGMASFCRECGHGGHLKCMKEWYTSALNLGCIFGCECNCKLF